MIEDLGKNARRRKLAEIRRALESMPPGALLNTGLSAIYLNVSTKSLARWRQVDGMGPPFLTPVVAKGEARTTQPYKYRKSDLDLFLSARVATGGFNSFAVDVEPWRVNEAGAIEGSALDLLRDYQMLEIDPVVATLLEALSEPWTSAGAMRPYRDELVDDMRKALEVIDSAAQTLQFEDRTAPAIGSSRGWGGL